MPYDELIRRPDNFILNGAQYCEHPISMQTNINLYRNIFLPETIWELRKGSEAKTNTLEQRRVATQRLAGWFHRLLTINVLRIQFLETRSKMVPIGISEAYLPLHLEVV